MSPLSLQPPPQMQQFYIQMFDVTCASKMTFFSYRRVCSHFIREGAADFLFCFVSLFLFPLPQMVDLAVKKRRSTEQLKR